MGVWVCLCVCVGVCVGGWISVWVCLWVWVWVWKVSSVRCSLVGCEVGVKCGCVRVGLVVHPSAYRLPERMCVREWVGGCGCAGV